MQIYINGQPRELLESLTVRRLLQQLEMTTPHVAVEVNEQLVPRKEHPSWSLQEGDKIEIVTLVGGG